MPRNSAGTYTLPNSAVVTGTTITATDTNATRNDLATELTDSVSRSNKGALLAALSLYDGVVGTPGLNFGTDTDTGLYRIGANDLGVAVGGSKLLEVTATVFSAFADVLLGSAKVILDTANSILKQTASNSSLTLKGNRSAADTGSDIITLSTATRTAGNLHDFQNNTTSKLAVDFSGQLKWPSGPASTATSPAPSAIVAITPDAGWTAANGLAYWKGPDNIVHFKGAAQNNTGGPSSAILSGGGNKLPAGFRPGASRIWTCMDNTGLHTYSIGINTLGALTSATNVTNLEVVPLDCISFLAEA